MITYSGWIRDRSYIAVVKKNFLAKDIVLDICKTT